MVSIHPIAEKGSSRKLGFRCSRFSETGGRAEAVKSWLFSMPSVLITVTTVRAYSDARRRLLDALSLSSG